MSTNNSDRYRNQCFILFFLLGLIDCLTVYEDQQAVLVCSSSQSSPTWRGPPGKTIYAIENSTTINQKLPNADRLSVDDDGYLVIANTQRSDAGQYNCSYAGVVLTITYLTVIVKPNIPQIMNKSTDGNRTFVRATEDQSVTLICISRGGYPEPEVAWKKGASFLQPTFKEAITESNTTFTVTVKYTFISRRSDDRVQFSCQSSYGDTEPPLISSVLLYLSLKPSAPVMTGSSSANERDTRAFNCYSDGCRPTGNIFWRYNGFKIQRNVTFTNEPAETYRMESSYEASLQRADNGKKLECVVTHEALLLVSELVDFTILQIHFAPLSVTLAGNKMIIANGINRLELTCTTGSANPVAKITWRNGQNILLDGIVKTTFVGVHNGMVLRETLTLKPTRDMDGDIISCSTSNTVSSTAVQNETSLDLKYHSITSVPSVVNATEGDSRIILPCSASSKPPSHFKWFKKGNNTPLYQGTGTVISNALNYSIGVINRSHAGQYRCEADNGIGTPDNTEGILILEVFYPPDVTVIVINASVNETVFICNATGLPSTYNYSSWTQTWPGSNVTLRSHNGSRDWKIKHSDYQDTGVYRCGASNGIKETFTEGSVFFVVKSYPIITFPTLKIDHKYKVPAILSKRFTIAIDVYSNGDNADTLDIVMLNSDNNPVNGTLFETNETEINLPVHGHLVTERGIRIHVAHTITDQDDFGVFVLNIQNEVGTVPMHLEIVPEGPPCSPVLPLVEDYKQTTIQISWIRCFHGGSSQTFVVQYSNDKFTWINGTFVVGGLSRSTVRLNATIEYLQPETTYSIRIFSYNVYGRSGFTFYPDVATDPKESTVPSTPLGLIAGGATGGLVVAAIVIVVLVFVVRRYHTADRGGSKKLLQENETNAPTHREGDSQDISINPMYEPADIVTPTKNEIPIVAQPDDKDGLYAPVGQSSNPVKHTKPSAGKQNRKVKKQKLGKIAKQEKRDRGEIYENSGACKGSGKDDENVYENPVCTMENETPIRTRNQDGLIYIDVDLPHLKKSNNGVSVIHGLDERTEYADIAFGKVGEKLPDSDDEEKKNNNQKDGEDN